MLRELLTFVCIKVREMFLSIRAVNDDRHSATLLATLILNTNTHNY